MTDELLSVGGLTDQQKSEVRKIFSDVVREYWAEDDVKSLARKASEDEVKRILEDTISAKVAGLVEHNPQAVLEQLFRSSGMIVRTKSSEYFDNIIGELLKDEESGIPEAIRAHVKLHLHELIQSSISEIVAGMVVNYIKDNADTLSHASQMLINKAFQNASVRPF